MVLIEVVKLFKWPMLDTTDQVKDRRVSLRVLLDAIITCKPIHVVSVSPFSYFNGNKAIFRQIGNSTLAKLFEGVCCVLLQLWKNLLGKGHVTSTTRQVNTGLSIACVHLCRSSFFSGHDRNSWLNWFVPL